MKKAYLQYWEESIKDSIVRPDGCSLHTTLIERNRFVNGIYESRKGQPVPNEYELAIGDPIEIEVSNSIWDEILNNGNTLRLMQHSMNNLNALEEIKIIFEDEYDI